MTARTRNTIGGVLVAIVLLVKIHELTGAQSYGVWTSPDRVWGAEVIYKRSHLVLGPTSVSVKIVCIAENSIMRAKFLGVVDRPSAIDSPPGFVAMDQQRFTIGPGSLYGSDVEAFVFERPSRCVGHGPDSD